MYRALMNDIKYLHKMTIVIEIQQKWTNSYTLSLQSTVYSCSGSLRIYIVQNIIFGVQPRFYHPLQIKNPNNTVWYSLYCNLKAQTT